MDEKSLENNIINRLPTRTKKKIKELSDIKNDTIWDEKMDENKIKPIQVQFIEDNCNCKETEHFYQIPEGENNR